jgi:excisionase family DNA binding protein
MKNTISQSLIPADASTGLRTKSDVSRLAQVSIRTVDLWMREKKIPFIKVGRSVRFRWTAVEAALLKFERKSV